MPEGQYRGDREDQDKGNGDILRAKGTILDLLEVQSNLKTKESEMGKVWPK